jgi:hypothetical protein
MERTKILGLALVVVFAMSVVATSVASAAAPEFKPAEAANKFTGTSGTSYLFGPGKIKVRCAKDKISGKLVGPTNAKGVEEVLVTYEECVATGSTGTTCAAHSPGQTNIIITNKLAGELGKVAATEAPASETGLDLKPASGASFVKIEGTCLTTTSVEGSVICEVDPVNVPDTTGTLVCSVHSGTKAFQKQVIKKFEGGAEDILEAFGGTSGLQGVENITFEKELEVN